MSRIPPRLVEKHKKLFSSLFLFLLAGIVAIGAMAKNGWLPSTDPITGKKTGWFGKELPKNASSSWNPIAPPIPTPTPQLSKEYIYAGGRLLAVEDSNANAAPPADLAVWRPSTGTWWVLGGTGSQQFSADWGGSGDIPVPGDYDGDGKTDLSIFRPSDGKWYVVRSSDNSSFIAEWGESTDTPSPADYDGDGRTDMAVYRSSTGHWYIIKSSDGGGWDIGWGAAGGDLMASADYDGDGKADIAVWRPSNQTFYFLTSSSSYSQGGSVYLASSSTAVPVSADYDGDGKANYAVRDGASWIILNAAGTASTTTTPSGDLATDKPVPNDYDGDGKCDIAVWRDSTGYWYIRKSADGSTRTEAWGTSGDIPVPAYYRR